MKSTIKHVVLILSFLMGASIFVYSQVSPSPESLNDENRERKKSLTINEYNTDAKGKNRWLDHVTVYNAQGYKIEETEYATYGMRSRTTYEYNAQNQCIKEVVYDDRNKVSRIKKFEYNADGTKKTQYNYLPNGRLYSKKEFQYSR